MQFHCGALSLIFPALVTALSYNPTPTATIDAGVVIGKATALSNGLGPSVNQFLGIPFAQSPPERFSPPRDVSTFSKPFNATTWKPACIQQFRCKRIVSVILLSSTDHSQIPSPARNLPRPCSIIPVDSHPQSLRTACISMCTLRLDHQAVMEEL